MHERFTTEIKALVGKKCWYVSCGGSAGASFQLLLGAKVKRKERLRNDSHSTEYREFEGELNLLVWCSWRLDGEDEPLASSDDPTEIIVPALETLNDTTVVRVVATEPGLDLVMDFDSGVRLAVFCDHVSEQSSFDGNWELWKEHGAMIVGRRSKLEFIAN